MLLQVAVTDIGQLTDIASVIERWAL